MKKFKIKMWYKMPRWIKRKKYVNERYSKNDYMNLYFFDSFEEMYDFVDKVENEEIERDYVARCYSVLKRFYVIDDETGEHEPTDRYSPMCGNLYFVKGNYGVNTVSHECLYGVLGYFSKKIDRPERIIDTSYDVNNIDVVSDCDDIEELVCYMHGGLVEQVWNVHYQMEENECIDNKKNE